MPPFVSDLESFTLIDRERRAAALASRTENAELFRLAIAVTLFGVIYSVTLRLVPRRSCSRVSSR